jgi:hypothetical protein
MVSFRFLGLVIISLEWTALAKQDRNQPHPHKGLLPSYNPGPFNVKISAGEEAKLQKGEAVMKQTPSSDPAAGGGAICIQDIAAPKAAVWNQILDLDSYSKKVPKVVNCKNYHVAQRGQEHSIKTRMVVGVLPGYSVGEVSHWNRAWLRKRKKMSRCPHCYISLW